MDRDQGSGEERDEILISISADGRVTKWSIRKGFESTGKPFTGENVGRKSPRRPGKSWNFNAAFHSWKRILVMESSHWNLKRISNEKMWFNVILLTTRIKRKC